MLGRMRVSTRGGRGGEGEQIEEQEKKEKREERRSNRKEERRNETDRSKYTKGRGQGQLVRKRQTAERQKGEMKKIW